MVIRLMTKEDYKDVYNVWLDCKMQSLNNIDDTFEGISKFLDRNPNTCFVAICDNIIVGVILVANDGRRGYIHHMAVSPKYRRLGIASKLVDVSLDALKAEGINKVACLVFADNEEGNKFWESKGFTIRTDLIYRNLALTELIKTET